MAHRYIDADKLKKEGWHLVRERTNRWQAYIEGMDLDLVPTADVVEVRHGRMVIEPDATVMHCNVCGLAYQYYAGLEEEWNYCPNCGAKMGKMGDNR